MRVAVKVLVSMMSAPASRYAPWIARTMSGRVSDRQVVVAAQVAGVVGEALAAEVGLDQLVALDERAHRAVHDHDPLAQQVVEPAPGGSRA